MSLAIYLAVWATVTLALCNVVSVVAWFDKRKDSKR